MALDILLLHEDDEVVAAVGSTLEEMGLSLRVFHSGVEAFTAIMESMPDAVIAGVGVRGGETRKLYQVMRHLTAARTVPFLFLGSADDSLRLAGDELRLPADGFLAEPFPASALRESVDLLRGAIGERDPERPEGPPGTATCNVREVLIDVIEFLVASRRSRMLTITAVGEEGLLSVEKGRLRHASFGELRGEEALLRLLGLDGIEVNFREESGGEPTPNIDIDWKIFASTHC